VLSTPEGVLPFLLDGLDGCHVGPFDAPVWEAAVVPLLDSPRALSEGRMRAAPFGSVPMAERVVAAYRDVTGTG
jgi:hypothetical protein